MKVPDGFRLLVVNQSGTVVETLDIGGYDLSKSGARIVIADDIDRVVSRETAAQGRAQVAAARSKRNG